MQCLGPHVRPGEVGGPALPLPSSTFTSARHSVPSPTCVLKKWVARCVSTTPGCTDTAQSPHACSPAAPPLGAACATACGGQWFMSRRRGVGSCPVCLAGRHPPPPPIMEAMLSPARAQPSTLLLRLQASELMGVKPHWQALLPLLPLLPPAAGCVRGGAAAPPQTRRWPAWRGRRR